MSRAYFVSPNRNIIEISGTHIDNIINYPEKFGLTKDFIQQSYNRYNEKLYSEGNARESIIKHIIINKGWLRIRQYPNFWSATCYILNKQTKDALFAFAEYALNSKIAHKFDEIHVLTLVNGIKETVTFDSILKNKLYNEFESKQVKLNFSFTDINSFNLSKEIDNLFELNKYKY